MWLLRLEAERMRNRLLGAFTLPSLCQNSSERSIEHVAAANLGYDRREHLQCFWQHFDFDGRRSQDFAVPVKEALAIGG